MQTARRFAPIDSSTITDIVMTQREKETLMSLTVVDENALPALIIDSMITSLFDDETLRRIAVAKITVPSLTGQGSVNDPRMGRTEYDTVCATCHKDNLGCPGHYGVIHLRKKIIHPYFHPTTLKVLSSVCNTCSNILLSADELGDQGLLKTSGEERMKMIVAASEKIPCRHIHDVNITACTPNPVYLTTRSKETKRILYHYPQAQIKGQKGKAPVEERERSIDEVENILRGISYEDAALLGFSNGSHPSRFILQSFPVIPPGARPDNVVNGIRSPDPLTTKYVEIVRLNELLGRDNLPEAERAATVTDLTTAITLFIDTPDADFAKGGSEQKSIRQKIQGKKAIIRGSLMGKRANYSGRTVAGPDPSLRFGQIRVPRAMISKLTKLVTVNSINRAHVMSLLKMTPPHISAIIPKHGKLAGRRVQVNKNVGSIYELQIGDQVERWLQDGDVVVANRQPTLDKESMMAYDVVIGDALTVGFHLSATTPHNLDFDGDEVNLHSMQTLEADAEAEGIMHIKNCIMDAQNNKPSVGVVYDALTGSYLMTQQDTIIDPNVYNDILMTITSQDGLPTLTSRLAQAGVHKYSGKGLFSAVLPPDFYYQKGRVVVMNGVLVNGVITKEHIGTAGGSMVQAIYKDYGRNRVVDFLTDVPFVVNRFLQERGFSVGLQDCELRADPLDRVKSDQELEVEALAERIKKIRRETSNSILSAIGRDIRNSSNEELLRRQIQEANALVGHYLEQVPTDPNRVALIGHFNKKAQEQEVIQGTIQRQLDLMDSSKVKLIEQLEGLRIDRDQLPLLEEELILLTNALPRRTIENTHGAILREEIAKAKLGVEALGSKLDDPFEEERRERQIVGIVNVAKTVGEKISTTRLDPMNALNVMTLSGAKGSLNNIAQITTSLFQQFNQGLRMPMSLSGGQRCLPYYAEGELDPEARGFCVNSFKKGLTPAELFFHQAGGREGLMDTSVKTAETGAIQHQVIKSLEDIKVAQDGTVRNAAGTIFQYVYGEDGFDASELERVNMGGIGDNSIISFIDIERLAGRINASYGYTEYTIDESVSLLPSDELQIDAERYDALEVEFGTDNNS